LKKESLFEKDKKEVRTSFDRRFGRKAEGSAYGRRDLNVKCNLQVLKQTQQSKVHSLTKITAGTKKSVEIQNSKQKKRCILYWKGAVGEGLQTIADHVEGPL